MSRPRRDLTGQVFGRLTVIKQADEYIAPNGQKRARWICRCSCGNPEQKIVYGDNLIKGKSKSCGCLCIERTKEANSKTNPFIVVNNFIVMYTFKGEPFLIDIDDYSKVKNYCWHLDKSGYVVACTNKTTVKIHRIIMNCPKGLDVDHKHGSNSLYDNRKQNLRIATPSQNNFNQKKPSTNTSGVVGVSWDKTKNRWVAYITANRKRITLGYYSNKEDAIKKRLEAEDDFHGEWSFSNSRAYQIKSMIEDVDKINAYCQRLLNLTHSIKE